MHKKCKFPEDGIEFEEKKLVCEKCKTGIYYRCTCGNKVCNICGYVQKGPYPCHILLNH
jgi:hypothetical protein